MEEVTADLTEEQQWQQECDLDFAEQCKIVWEGIKKGVKYDGCTGVPDFNFGKDCCGEHDYHYQIDGITRMEADRRLRVCLLKKGTQTKGLHRFGFYMIAWSYWVGVRLVGWNFYRKKQNEALAKRGTVDDPNRLVGGP